jgi:hypothetical protein
MSRRFTSARQLMADLLDRHEAGTISPIGYPDYASFSDVGEIDRFAQELCEAERSRAVKIAKGRGRNSDQIAHVRLEDASRLYLLLASSTSQRTGRRSHQPANERSGSPCRIRGGRSIAARRVEQGTVLAGFLA